MTTSADLVVERSGDRVVIRLLGEVDMGNAAQVGEELAGSVSNDAAGLVLDLSGLTYLDSAGVELLFDLARRLRHRRQALQLVLPPTSPLQRLLALTDVMSVVDVHETTEAGLAALASLDPDG